MKLIGTNLKSVLSAALLLVGATALNQNAFAQTSNASKVEGVCLYSKTKFRGEEFCATTDIRFIPLRFRTRSIRMAKGYEVTLYRFPFFIGASSNQQKDNANFTELSAGKARSLRLTAVRTNNFASIVPIISMLLGEDEYEDPNDYDGDGFTNDVEDDYGTDPKDPNSTPPDIDGDKIPDDVDDDRDGDGVPNGVEDDNDTDPNDPLDFPDLTPPTLIVNNAVSVKTAQEQVVVTGSVIDTEQPYSGLAEFYIDSDQYAGSKFTGARSDSTGEFSIEVPLKLGVNNLNVIAIDREGNRSTVALSRTRGITPIIEGVDPANGTVSTEGTISIGGRIRTNLPIDQFTLLINNSQVVTTGSNQPELYEFSFDNVVLKLGINTFSFKLSSDFGGDTQTITINYVPDGADTFPEPKISGVNPSNEATLNQSSFRVGAQVESSAGPLTVRVNGNQVLNESEGLTFYVVNEVVTFPGSQNEVTTTIEATDSLGKTTTETVTHYRDNSGPVIVLDQAFQPLPQINQVDSSPVLFTGTVADANLSAVLVNDQPVELTPGNTPDTYRFEVRIPVEGDQTVPVSFGAYDRSGNKHIIEYSLLNIASAGVKAILPPEGTTYLSRGEPISVQVAARLNGQEASDQIVAYLESAGRASAQALAINGTLASGDIQLPASAAKQTIIFELRNQQGQRITQDATNVEVKAAEDVELEVVRVEPLNNAQFIEPNAAVEVYFNQAIDLSKLNLVVKETLHGKSYVTKDPLGEDFIRAKGYELVDINRDLEVVPGQLNIVPQGAGAVFAADRLFGYNSDIFVEVSYDGEQLSRSRFKVRELPTFINGGVVDQFGQPLKGVEVSLPALNRTTKTNGDGGFSFGYQEAADEIIDGGSYQLLINDGFRNPKFGNINSTINVQRNRANNLSGFTLQELDNSVSFYSFKSDAVNSLAGGDLVIDMSDARAIFANTRTSGPVHAQFLPIEHIGVQTFQFAIPHWLFGIQPKGVKVEGEAKLKIKIPKLRGSYDYIDPENYQYVVLLGYSAAGQVVEPIGVAKIENLSVSSVGKLHLSSLDYIGYAVVPPSLNDQLIQYANGEISLQQLKAELQALKLP